MTFIFVLNNITLFLLDSFTYFSYYISAENKIKAGQLNVIQVLVEVMLVHKADAVVAQNAAGALRNICVNGFLIMSGWSSSFTFEFMSFLYILALVLFVYFGYKA